MTLGRILAHGLGGRSDLPVPLWLAQYGAAAALLVSFTVLGVFWRTPRLEGAAARDGRPLPDWVQRFADARATRVGLRVLGCCWPWSPWPWPPSAPTTAAQIRP